MSYPRLPATAPRRGFWSGLRRHSGTIAAVALVGLAGMTFAVYADLVPGENPWRTAWSILGMFVAIGTGISMVWRMSHSWLVFLINAGIALILPLDPFGTLVALTWVMATASARRLGIALALAALVTAVTLARDAFRDPPGVIAVSTDSATGQLHLLPGFGYAIIGAVILLVIIGFIRRAT